MSKDQIEYDRCIATFKSWINWPGRTDFGGLMLGLADYYCEIRILEDILGIAEADRFDPIAQIEWLRKGN